MKTKTLSILFALVMVLSMSVGVFAQDFDETWDENTVLTVFSDVDMVFPDLFADEDSDFLWFDGPSAFPSEFPGAPDYYSKAPIAIDTDDTGAEQPYEGKFTFDACGDGLIKYEVTLKRDNTDPMTYNSTAAPNDKYGPEKVTYINKISAVVTLDGVDYEADVKKCSAPEGCHYIVYNKNGEAKLTGYLYAPVVLDDYDTPEVTMVIKTSNYMTALWTTEKHYVTVSGTATPSGEKKSYCQDMTPYAVQDMPKNLSYVRAKYDQNTGEARFQATIRNFAQESALGYKAKTNYVIPADVIIDPFFDADGNLWKVGDRKTDYVCKYTVYNNANAAPRTDYCRFGEGIALAPNAIVRFDITIEHISSKVLTKYDGGNIPFVFRLGGLKMFIGAWAPLENTISGGEYAEFEPVDFPCPIVSRLQVKNPLKPFMTFFEMDPDPAIKPSGPYGVYEGGLWGMYQKCGKFAYMAVRLYNDGIVDEHIDLNKVAVAVNGGTPMSWHWVLSSVDPWKNIVTLEPGEYVVLIGRAKVTDIPAQLNSDVAMTGAVNFLDYGFYISGKVFSDHNNTNCVAAPK